MFDRARYRIIDLVRRDTVERCEERSANQLEAITNDPGVRVITGEAPTTLTMKGLVNGIDAFSIERQDEFFAGEVTADNTLGPAYPNLKLVGIDNTSGAVDDLIEGNTWINPQSV